LHLKSLTLKGFKSFADKTALSFEPGISVVIGPNGSGKSNVTDAVLWVLGEQSAKALRGQAMEDVIFAGSSARKALGVAEVDLVLDNTCSTLPLDFSEIAITRRMYRSGESEYLLNGTPCRLMDIHELLHDTGLGRATYSIISQGQLEEVLSSRPEDRRALVEEAAGVLKHKRRRERAVRKLAGIDSFIQRARDLMGEIERQLKPLARQATRAQDHHVLAEKIKEVEVSLAVDDLRALQQEWNKRDKEDREAQASAEIAQYRLSEKQKELSKFQLLLEEKGLFVGDLSEQRRRLQSVLERLSSGLLLLEEKGKNLIERLSELRAKVHQSQSRTAVRESELVSLREKQQETDASLKAQYALLGELRREAEAARKDRLAADESFAQASGQARRLRKTLDTLKEESARIEQSVASAQLEAELIAEHLNQVKEQRAKLTATLSARRSKLEQVDQQVTKLTRDRALADADVDKRVRVLDSKRRDFRDMQDKVSSLRAEVRGLEEVERAFASAAPAVAWILSQERKFPGIVGSLVEHISVSPEYEQLVEHVLGADLFALLVADTKVAAAIAKELSGQTAGEGSLVPVATAAQTLPAAPEGFIRVVDLIECKDEYRPALNALLGDVLVADDLASAMSTGPLSGRIATLSGETLWPSGKLTVGRSISDSAGVLERQRRMNELTDLIEAEVAKADELEASVTSAEEALGLAQQDAFELGQQLASIVGSRESLRDEIGRLESELSGLSADEARGSARISEVNARTETLTPNLKQIQHDMTSTVTELQKADELVADSKQLQENKFRDESAVNQRLSTCQVEIATVSEREVHLKRQIASITAELSDLQTAIEAARQSEVALELLRQRVQPVHDLYSALLERAEHWASKLLDRARFEQADSQSLRDSIHSAQDEVRAIQKEHEEIAQVIGDIRVVKGRLEVQVSTAVNRIVSELKVPLEIAIEQPPLDNRAATEEKLRALQRKIGAMGPVNPIAVQEHKALEERLSRISASVEDVIASRQALSKVIAAIDRKMKMRFIETFEEVAINFQNIFSQLFPGGSGALTLTDPDDFQATGIEVTAQPLGKRLTKMSLMSGGEKSLTALALLFALYRSRPCPFYVLDEVDAALDDTNLRRFIVFIESMRKQTQFIVITHQRRTMEMADVLYGASMHADGVTKLLSQKLQRETIGSKTDGRTLV